MVETTPEQLRETVADRLRRSLRHAGMTQDDMAQYLEVHRNSVNAWVAGRTAIMPALLRLWAQRTNVPLEWLKTGQWPANTESSPPNA
jgi:transcriptional regulator with XRE-family HTH domain